jgi:hypothetical protein
MLGFGGTCSYRDRTAATTMIHGDGPFFHGGPVPIRGRGHAPWWPLPAAMLAPAGGPLRSVDT